MGFNINEYTTVKLHYKDIALIAVALGKYQQDFSQTADKGILEHAERLTNMLGNEMANTCRK